MSTPKRPARPADRLAWRDQLKGELESAAKLSSGTMQVVLHKMLAVIGNARPGGSLEQKAFQELQEAFSRHTEEPSFQELPPVIADCLEWIHVCFILPSMAAGGGAGAKKGAGGRAEAGRSPGGAAGKKSGKDGFDSGSDARARALMGEAPVEANPQQKQQQDLETIKNWMMNPALGKVKG